MKLFLNISEFKKLQKNASNIEMSKTLNVSRSQLWRAKSGEPVGEKFIAGFKSAYPRMSTDKFFLTK